MYVLIFSERFDKSFSEISEKKIRRQVWNKIKRLEFSAPLGKKLKGNPYWSIRVDKYRIIYELKGSQIIVADILKRKHDYREL